MNLIDELDKFKNELNYNKYLIAKNKAGAEYTQKDKELREKMKVVHRNLAAAKAHKDYSLTAIIDNLRDIVNESYNEGYYNDHDYSRFLKNTGADLDKDIDNLNKIIGAKVTEDDIDNYDALTVPQRAELMNKFGYDYNSKKARAEFFEKMANREREEELKKIWNTDLPNPIKHPIDFVQNFSLSYGPQSLAKNYAQINYDKINTDERRYNPINNPELFGMGALGTLANTAETLSFGNSGKAINAAAKYAADKGQKIMGTKAGKAINAAAKYVVDKGQKIMGTNAGKAINAAGKAASAATKKVDDLLQKPMNNKYASEILDITAAPSIYGLGDYLIYDDGTNEAKQAGTGYAINAAAGPVASRAFKGLARRSGSSTLNDIVDYIQDEPYGKLKEAKSKASNDVDKIIRGEDTKLFGDEYNYVKDEINKKSGNALDFPYVEPVISLGPESKYITYSENLDKYKGRIPEMISVPEHKKSKEFLEAFDNKLGGAYKVNAYDPNLLSEYNSYMRTDGKSSIPQMLLSDAFNYGRTYGTNKAGRGQWASSVPLIGEVFNKVYEDVNKAKEEKEKELVNERYGIKKSNIDTSKLTTEEKKIVDMIKENPGLLKGLGKAQDVATVSKFLIYHPGIMMDNK